MHSKSVSFPYSLISSFLKEMSWCFCSIVKTSKIKHIKEKVHCYNNSFINILPLCQSCNPGPFFLNIYATFSTHSHLVQYN